MGYNKTRRLVEKDSWTPSQYRHNLIGSELVGIRIKVHLNPKARNLMFITGNITLPDR
jgi:hypothetical protein